METGHQPVTTVGKSPGVQASWVFWSRQLFPPRRRSGDCHAARLWL